MITLIPTATPFTPTTLDRLPTEQAVLRPIVDAAEETSDAFEAGEAIEISGYQAYLQQAGQHKILTAAEELQLAVRIQAGRLTEGQFTVDALHARDDEAPGTADQAALRLDAELIRTHLRTLNDREALIIELRTGLNDGAEWTLDEVGGRLKVSRERVRQLEERAYRKLRALLMPAAANAN